MTRMITIVPRENNFLYSEFETATKQGIESRMSNYGNTCFGGRTGQSYNGRVKNGFIFLYTAQKFRRKNKTVYKFGKAKKRNGANNHNFTTEIIRRSHWKVRVYKFPLDRVITADQGLRTFKISITG